MIMMTNILKFNSDDDLPLRKTLECRNMITVVRSATSTTLKIF